MAKGGKAPKKTAKKKAAKKVAKKVNNQAIEQALGGLLEAQELLHRSVAYMKAAINVVNAELGLELDIQGMTATESQNYVQQPAPLKKGAVPKPANGETFTVEELASPGVFTRRVLASILTSLGGQPAGKMPPALRTAIMEAQGGRVEEEEIGDCDFSGDEGVPVKILEVGEDTYSCGPKVDALVSGKSAEEKHEILLQLIDGEIEV